MLQLAQKNTKPKTTNEEPTEIITSLQEAETYLRKVNEWNSVNKMDRETIMNWANFLKNKGVTK
jgi:hypothetical protein